MRKSSLKENLPPVIAKAEQALKKAVRKVIIEHKQTGDPLVVWRDGKIVHIPASRLRVR
ncbi:MAG: hypothetical protein HYS56_00955 [Candidatus Omnitrophica bacterium]|nr:hypothetical protein [Candidatus Omnitrophota bacterium]